jgi:hypothetical protein
MTNRELIKKLLNEDLDAEVAQWVKVLSELPGKPPLSTRLAIDRRKVSLQQMRLTDEYRELRDLVGDDATAQGVILLLIHEELEIVRKEKSSVSEKRRFTGGYYESVWRNVATGLDDGSPGPVGISLVDCDIVRMRDYRGRNRGRRNEIGGCDE